MSAFFLLFLAARPAFAGAAGDALPFLKLDAGARGAAMAGAYSAAGDDALSVFYNPAGTALADKKQVLLGHNEWLEEMRNETLAYLHPLTRNLTVFAGANILLSGSMARREAVSGEVTGSFSVFEGAGGAGLAWGMGAGWYGGAAFKVLLQKADGERAAAWAGDAGLLKKAGDWRFGAAASNFGTRLKFGRESFPLPLLLRGGISRTFFRNYTLAAEISKPGQSDISGAVGGEARIIAGPREYFFLRAGYASGRSRNAGSGATAGLGLSSGDLRLDYAFAPYGDLGNSHRVTAALCFGASRPEDLRRRPYGKRPPPREKKQAAPAKKEPVKNGGKRATGKEDVYFMW